MHYQLHTFHFAGRRDDEGTRRTSGVERVAFFAAAGLFSAENLRHPNMVLAFVHPQMTTPPTHTANNCSVFCCFIALLCSACNSELGAFPDGAQDAIGWTKHLTMLEDAMTMEQEVFLRT